MDNSSLANLLLAVDMFSRNGKEELFKMAASKLPPDKLPEFEAEWNKQKGDLFIDDIKNKMQSVKDSIANGNKNI